MKNPINLKYLPRIIKNRKNMDDEIIVDMGRIIPRSYWSIRTIFIAGFCFLMFFGFFVFGSSENITLVVSSNMTSEEVSEIISNCGGRVTGISKNTYKISLSKFKNISLFLEKIKQNKQIEKVELKR